MKTEIEIKEKMESLEKALQELKPGHDHFKTVYESEIYILQWALNKR
jgi:hypothetical protein